VRAAVQQGGVLVVLGVEYNVMLPEDLHGLGLFAHGGFGGGDVPMVFQRHGCSFFWVACVAV